MLARVAELLDRLRRPAYTGENRCLPCTAINTAIAISAAMVLAQIRIGIAAAFLVLAVTTIWLRGYLVPYTPRIADRYLPASLVRTLKPIEPPSTVRGTLALAGDGAIDPTAFLREIGAIEEGPGGDLRTTEAFASHLRSAVEEIRCDPDPESATADEPPIPTAAIATLLGVDAVTVDRWTPPVVRAGGETVQWRSTAALVADTATDRALAERSDRWRTIPSRRRLPILAALRTVLERCPVCEGPVEADRRDPADCCRPDVQVSDCADCGERLLVVDPIGEGVAARSPADDPTAGAGTERSAGDRRRSGA